MGFEMTTGPVAAAQPTSPDTAPWLEVTRLEAVTPLDRQFGVDATGLLMDAIARRLGG